MGLGPERNNLKTFGTLTHPNAHLLHTQNFQKLVIKKKQEGRGGKFEQKCGVVYTTQKQDLIFGREIRLKYFLFCCTLSIKEELSHDPVLYNDIILELEAKWGKKKY